MLSPMCNPPLYYRHRSVIMPKVWITNDIGIISIRENNREFHIDLEFQSDNIRTLKTRSSTTTCTRALLGSRITSSKWTEWTMVSWDVTDSENNQSFHAASIMEIFSIYASIQYTIVTKAQLNAFVDALNQNIAGIAAGESYEPSDIFRRSMNTVGIRCREESLCLIS